MWWAETEFQLMKPLPNNGGTLRDAILNYERFTGQRHPDAKPKIQAPAAAMYLWSWFWQLNTGRAIGGMGTLLPIPPSEVFAWCQLSGNRLNRWEMTTLQQLDAAFLRTQNER